MVCTLPAKQIGILPGSFRWRHLTMRHTSNGHILITVPGLYKKALTRMPSALRSRCATVALVKPFWQSISFSGEFSQEGSTDRGGLYCTDIVLGEAYRMSVFFRRLQTQHRVACRECVLTDLGINRACYVHCGCARGLKQTYYSSNKMSIYHWFIACTWVQLGAEAVPRSIYI